MSNASNASGNVNAAFRAVFVEAKNGVQTAERINGRRAFPDRSGHQPKVGETWMVTVAGENPTRTVHFVECLERINEETPQPAAPVASVIKAQPQVVRAPGNDVFARVAAWGAPFKSIALSDLKFTLARRKVEGDATASTMYAQLGSTMASAKALREVADTAAGQLKQVYSRDYEVALDLFAARKVMAQLLVDKAELAKDTLSYARLVKQLKAKADEQLAEQITATKEALDTKRAGHNEAMAIGKKSLADAEFEGKFMQDEDCINSVIALLEKKANHEVMAADYRKQLVVDLNTFEQHVAAMS